MHLVIASILLTGLAASFGLAVLLIADWLEVAEDCAVPIVLTGETARRVNAGELAVIHSIAEVPRGER